MPNLASIIPAMDKIFQQLKKDASNMEYLTPIHATIKMGKKLLDKYYMPTTDESEVYCISTSMSKYPLPMIQKLMYSSLTPMLQTSILYNNGMEWGVGQSCMHNCFRGIWLCLCSHHGYCSSRTTGSEGICSLCTYCPLLLMLMLSCSRLVILTICSTTMSQHLQLTLLPACMMNSNVILARNLILVWRMFLHGGEHIVRHILACIRWLWTIIQFLVSWFLWLPSSRLTSSLSDICRCWARLQQRTAPSLAHQKPTFGWVNMAAHVSWSLEQDGLCWEQRYQGKEVIMTGSNFICFSVDYDYYMPDPP